MNDTKHNPLRRCDVNSRTHAEQLISTAIDFVEHMRADPRLTDAVVLLVKARDRVSDFVDGIGLEQPIVNEPGRNWQLSDNAKKDISEIESNAKWGPKP
jgi:hypothetical protein